VTPTAFQRIWQRVPSSTLVVVGHGPLKDELIAYCEANWLTAVVGFIGPVGSVDVRKRMTQACVFLQGSMTTGVGWIKGCAVCR
jgi:glycosyltransferase involved in cell wall biosynthesis